jgi:hypothetical protein
MASDDSRCRDNHEGTLCGKCQSGASLWGGKCIPCAYTNGLLVVGVIFISSLVLTWFMMIHPSSSSLSLLLIDYWQISQLTVGPFKSQQLQFFLGILSLDVSAINLSSSSSNCPFPISEIGAAVSGLMLPFLLITELGICVLGFIVYINITHKPGRNSDVTVKNIGGGIHFYFPPNRRMKKFWRGLWGVVFLSYQNVVRVALELINCRAVGSESVVSGYPGVTCGSNQHIVTVRRRPSPLLPRYCFERISLFSITPSYAPILQH